MPIYEYQCKAGHVTEKYEPMKQANDCILCPECSYQKRAARIVSRTGMPILKAGSGGFYKPNA